MAIISWPAGLKPQAMELSLDARNQSFESELTGLVQTATLPGSRWRAQITFSNVTGTASGMLRGLLAALKGRAGQFYLPAFGALNPTGTGLGTPLVNGSNQTGYSIITDGWTANQSAALKMGDYLQIGNGFHICTDDVMVNASGQATIYISPELRKSPADNSAVVISNPVIVMQLEDDAQARFAQTPGKIYAISFSCREVIDV